MDVPYGVPNPVDETIAPGSRLLTESPKGPRRDTITSGKVPILSPKEAESVLRAADAKAHLSPRGFYHFFAPSQAESEKTPLRSFTLETDANFVLDYLSVVGMEVRLTVACVPPPSGVVMAPSYICVWQRWRATGSAAGFWFGTLALGQSHVVVRPVFCDFR